MGRTRAAASLTADVDDLDGRGSGEDRSTPTSSYFPSRYLGELVRSRSWLRPDAGERRWRSEDFDADDVFPLVRQRAHASGAARTMALPLGVEIAAGRESANADAIDHWPAIMLLARAAPYACHPRHESACCSTRRR